MKKVLPYLLDSVLFIVGLAMVIIFQKNISIQSLGGMIVGLALLLTVLYRYNKRFQ